MSEFENMPSLPPVQTEQPSDLLLLGFVDAVERKAITSMSLSVTTNGTLLSGMLVSRSQWFADLAASTRSEFASELVRIVGAQLDEFDEARRWDAEADQDREEPTFLHLQDVSVVSGGNAVPLGYWRCRISDVTAWSFSTLGPAL